MAMGWLALERVETMEGFWRKDNRIYSHHVICERSRRGPDTSIARFEGESSHVENWDKVFVVIGSRQEGVGRDRLCTSNNVMHIFIRGQILCDRVVL
jgi:hypothetical protein